MLRPEQIVRLKMIDILPYIEWVIVEIDKSLVHPWGYAANERSIILGSLICGYSYYRPDIDSAMAEVITRYVLPRYKKVGWKINTYDLGCTRYISFTLPKHLKTT